MDLAKILAALPAVAGSWPGVVSVLIVTVAWVVVARRVNRNKNLLKRLEKVPSKDRAKVLQKEMGGVPLPDGVSEERYFQHRTHTLLLIAFLALLGAICFLFTVTVLALTRPDLARAVGVNVENVDPALRDDCSYVMFTVKDYGPSTVVFRLDGKTTSTRVKPDTPQGEGMDGVAVLRGYDANRDVPIGVGGAYKGDVPYAKDETFRPGSRRFFAVGTGGHLDGRTYTVRVVDSNDSELRTFTGNHGIRLNACSVYSDGVTFVMAPPTMSDASPGGHIPPPPPPPPQLTPWIEASFEDLSYDNGRVRLVASAQRAGGSDAGIRTMALIHLVPPSASAAARVRGCPGPWCGFVQPLAIAHSVENIGLADGRLSQMRPEAEISATNLYSIGWSDRYRNSFEDVKPLPNDAKVVAIAVDTRSFTVPGGAVRGRYIVGALAALPGGERTPIAYRKFLRAVCLTENLEEGEKELDALMNGKTLERPCDRTKTQASES